ncbi:hypothetical protein TcCL_ESM05103, partial [Trypanosoma cruzi]
GWFKEMALVHFTRSPSGAILAPVLRTWYANMAICRCTPPLLVKLGMSEASLTVATSMTGLHLILGSTTKPRRIRPLRDMLRISGRLKYQIVGHKCSRPSCGCGPGVGGPARAPHRRKGANEHEIRPRRCGRAESKRSA